MPKIQMNPGVYPNTLFDDYVRIDAVNQSVLHDARSAAHIQAAMERESDVSDSMVLGQALHARILESTTADRLIIDGPINLKTGKPFGADTIAYADFCAANPGKIVLTKDARTKVDRMTRNIMAHERARSLVAADGMRELTLIWDEPVAVPGGPEMTIRMKARVDHYVPGVLAYDLKTSRSADPEAWSWALRDFGYHIQDNVYRRGLRACFGVDVPFGFLVVENTEPHAVKIYEIDPDPLWPDGPTTADVARRDVDRALMMIAACRAKKLDRWPGYPETAEIERCSLPWSVLRRYEEEINKEGDAR